MVKILHGTKKVEKWNQEKNNNILLDNESYENTTENNNKFEKTAEKSTMKYIDFEIYKKKRECRFVKDVDEQQAEQHKLIEK